MIIECPACKSRAKLPDSKEGAKVRCPECERVYVARPVGAARGASRGPDPFRILLIGGAGLVVLLVVVKFAGKESPPVAAAPTVEVAPAPELEPVVDLTGWDSPAVKVARAVHDFVVAGEEDKILSRIDGERVWTFRQDPDPPQLAPPEEASDSAGAEEAEDAAPAETVVDERAWDELGADEQAAFVASVAEELESGPTHDWLVAWEPYDGWVVRETDDEAVVRLKLASLEDAAQPDRHIEWRLAQRDGLWRAWYWKRWYSEDELAAALRARRPKKTTSRTLSDGSFVIEGRIRPIEHLEETPPEECERIDRLCEELIDLEAAPSVRSEARVELTAIGKPAIPALLTKLTTVPLETEDQAIQLNLVSEVLSDITGYRTTFRPHEIVGGTQELQESGLKQWFGWYDRKFERFETAGPEADLFEGLAPRNEKERREFEQIKREQEGG